MNNQEYELSLKKSIKFWEDLYIDYKQMLENLFKDKKTFDITCELFIWYKDLLREEKNYAEKLMKETKEELTYFRQGLNPPYCYNWKSKN